MFPLSWILVLEIVLPQGKVFVKLCLRFVFLLASGTYFNLVNFLHHKSYQTRNEMTKFSNKCSWQKGVFLCSCKYKSPLKKYTQIYTHHQSQWVLLLFFLFSATFQHKMLGRSWTRTGRVTWG